MSNISRRATLAALLGVAIAVPSQASTVAVTPEDVMERWYTLILRLVRHTATYSPPVASRAFAYFGVTVYEALASGHGNFRSMAGQLRALTPLPAREAGAAYDDAIVLNAAMADAAQNFFANTGPSGQHALAAMETKMRDQVTAGRAPDVVQRSIDYGKAVAGHILTWSQDDGGAVVENLGFPDHYELTPGPAHWVPTSPINLQQTPLLPNWGNNRPFAMPGNAACGLMPPPAYSEDPSSQFYREAKEVCDTRNSLTPEQRAIARFWSDDPMLSPTPAGHWVSILLQISARDHLKAEHLADVLMRVGVAVADGFIGCWQSKYQYDLVRPITYIRRTMEAKWEPLLITPPFPEYPSGHSTQSGAAAVVLTQFFGDNFAFDDATHIRDNIPARHFTSFWAAAQEAAISRLYGGIHFRSAIERGLDQGRCIGAFTNALKTVV